jgi:hypothetical protein
MKQSTLKSFFQVNGTAGGESKETATPQPQQQKRKGRGKMDHDAQEARTTIELAQNVKRQELREQIEYYLSDDNLKRDDFYRNTILSSEKGNGWFSIQHIMTAPKIKAKGVEVEEVVEALEGSKSKSKSVEIMKGDDEEVWIRRQNGRALPPKQTYGRYSGKRRRSYDDDDNDDSGCMGYSSYDRDTLLDYGVKPWDDDADMVLGAIHGW